MKRIVAVVPPALARKLPLRRLRLDVLWLLQASLERWPRSFVTSTPLGFRLAGTTSDVIQRFVNVYGVWEPGITAWVQDHLRLGDVAVDIGANCGYYTLLFARCVGAEGAVIAVEPVPSIFVQLNENVRINGFENVSTHDAAAAADAGTIEIFRSDPANLGWSGSVATPGSVSEGLVPRRRAADMIPPDLVGRIRLVKIDTEGDEYGVLVGLGDVLERLGAGAAVVVEVTPDKLAERGHRADAVFELMRSHGFAIYGFPGGELSDETAIPRLLPLHEPPNDQVDVLFVKR